MNHREETGMERLGDSTSLGFVLLETLDAHGWTVTVQRAFAGGLVDEDVAGVLVVVSKNGHEVRRVGRSVAEVAGEVFAEATRVQRAVKQHPPRLPTVMAWISPKS